MTRLTSQTTSAKSRRPLLLKSNLTSGSSAAIQPRLLKTITTQRSRAAGSRPYPRTYTVEVQISRRWRGSQDLDLQLRAVHRVQGATSPRGRDPNGPAVGRRADLCSTVLEPFRNGLVRVTERVEPVGLDNRDRRVDGRDERLPRRRADPVVADLEHPRCDGPVRGEHPAPRPGAGENVCVPKTSRNTSEASWSVRDAPAG